MLRDATAFMGGTSPVSCRGLRIQCVSCPAKAGHPVITAEDGMSATTGSSAFADDDNMRFRPRIALEFYDRYRGRNDGQRRQELTRHHRGRQDGRQSAVPQSGHLRDRGGDRRLSRAPCTNCSSCRRPASPMCRSSATASTAAIPIRSICFASSTCTSARMSRTIDLRPYIAPHTLKLGPDGLIYITCENSAVVAVIDPQDQQGRRGDRFRLDQRPSADHRAGRRSASTPRTRKTARSR